ncbi:4'-phosphopantetheinyl transferase family protein [Paenibacillus spiritus]|nr:4'-phosphopantetheinyl transferase superfamily protein [Paenibacillus spiritus]
MEIYALRLSRELSGPEYRMLLEQTDPVKRERIARFLRPRDAQRSLLGDALIRWALVRHLNLPPEGSNTLVFDQNEYGKPLLAAPGGVHFNLSHSGDWVVCAVAAAPVGVDVEELREAPLEIAERFFHNKERRLLNAASPEERGELFYRLWTLKESYIKAVGLGLSLALDSFSVDGGTGTVLRRDTEERWLHRAWKLDERHMMALCASDGSECREERRMDLDEFLTVRSRPGRIGAEEGSACWTR